MSFHTTDGWHWRRLEDGTVQVFNDRLGVQHKMDASTWASVVASVSAGGETAERFAQAEAFHSGGKPVGTLVSIHINGVEVVHATGAYLTYEDICREASQPVGATCVVHGPEGREGRELVSGDAIEVAEGLVINCVVTGSA